jgi:hypothetical protein
VPFYAFGPLRITAVRNLPFVASTEGEPTVIECPLHDSLRSVYPWFALGGLLLLRRATRTRAAWTLLFPLGASYVGLYLAENAVGRLALWYVTPTVCSIFCEILRSLALGLAFLLVLSDLIRIRQRFLRFVVTTLVIFVTGSTALLFNAPFLLESWVWVVAFGLLLVLFRLGLSLGAALLRRFAHGPVLPRCAGICLVPALSSILLLAAIGLTICSPAFMMTHRVLSMTLYFVAATPQPLLAPYFVFFWFVLPALWSPFYRQHFTDCLGAGPS